MLSTLGENKCVVIELKSLEAAGVICFVAVGATLVGSIYIGVHEQDKVVH